MKKKLGLVLVILTSLAIVTIGTVTPDSVPSPGVDVTSALMSVVSK